MAAMNAHSSGSGAWTSRLVQCALLAALTAVATLIAIPIVGGHGYVNLGDAVAFFAVFAVGGWACAASAAVGSALADVISGYFIYAPATFIIKGAMALLASLMLKKTRIAPLSFAVGGLIMPVGYLLYEMLIYSPAVAAAGLPWNLVQYAVCASVGTLIVAVADRSGLIKR